MNLQIPIYYAQQIINDLSFEIEFNVSAKNNQKIFINRTSLK